LRELDNKKVLFNKFSVRYLVVKPARVNAAYDCIAVIMNLKPTPEKPEQAQ